MNATKTEQNENTTVTGAPLFDANKKVNVTINGATKKFPMIYYCVNRIEFAFDLHELELDEAGKPIINPDTGKYRHSYIVNDESGKKSPIFKSYKFDRLPVLDPKTGKPDPTAFACSFVIQADDPRRDDLYAKIEQMRRNSLNMIITETQWQQHVNSAAYLLQKKVEKLENDYDDEKKLNASLYEKNKALEDKLRKMGVAT